MLGHPLLLGSDHLLRATLYLNVHLPDHLKMVLSSNLLIVVSLIHLVLNINLKTKSLANLGLCRGMSNKVLIHAFCIIIIPSYRTSL
jgi:hypothetical protein